MSFHCIAHPKPLFFAFTLVHPWGLINDHVLDLTNPIPGLQKLNGAYFLTNEVSMSVKKRKKYPKLFKLDAVQLVLEQCNSIADVSRNLDIGRGTLQRWIREYQDQQAEAFPGNGRTSSEQEKIRQLEGEVVGGFVDTLLRVGENSLAGYGPITLMKRPVRICRQGIVGRAGERNRPYPINSLSFQHQANYWPLLQKFYVC